MRPSLRRVRSWVSSRERPIESTLSFTSPTLVRTNFLVAQALDPPMARTAIGTATKNFRSMFDLLLLRRPGLIGPLYTHFGLEPSGPCGVLGPRANASPVGRSIQTR